MLPTICSAVPCCAVLWVGKGEGARKEVGKGEEGREEIRRKEQRLPYLIAC